MIRKFVTPQLEQLGRCIPDLILVVDSGGEIVYANRGRGPFSRAELLGKRLQSLLITSEVEKADVALAEVMLTGTSTLIDVKGTSDESGQVWYSQRYSPIEADGAVIGMMVLEDDVTEKLKLVEEIELERAKAMHATKFATLGEMASGIAHEINTPLSHIQLLASMLKEKADGGQLVLEDARAISAQIETTVLRISKTVTSLRSFAHQVEGDPFESIAIAQVIAESLDLMRERLRTADVELRMPTISPEIKIECRSIQITQILLNLCGNAIDAQEGRDSRWIQFEIKDLGMSVEVAVIDNGPGIPKEVREKIMQPFFTTKGSVRGTGLGLSISKGIAGFHHGLLYLDESYPRTRFVLLLPKLQPVKAAG